MGLFSWLLLGLGVGYVVHKDNQKFANMRQDYYNTYGQFMSDNDKKYIHQKNEKMVYQYFDERFNYYLNHYDEVANKMNFSEETRKLDGLEKEFVFRSNCGYLAYNDIIAKWAPDWCRKFQIISNPDYKPPHNFLSVRPKVPKQHSYLIIAAVANGLSARELHSMGVLTSYQNTTANPFDIPHMYFGETNPGEELWRIISSTRADPKWGNMRTNFLYRDDPNYLEDAWDEWCSDSPKPYTSINVSNKNHFMGFVKLKQEGKIK